MQKFEPILWKEDAVPTCAIDCHDCGLYEHGSRMMWGEGNPAAPIMIVLDNPGMREDKEGQPFVCGTRQTLQKGAFDAGIDRESLYVTYILKRRPKRKYDKEETRSICMQHLGFQLDRYKPNLIFCMGNVALQSFTHRDDIDVKGLRGKIHMMNGYHIAVAYHPLAVRRRPNLQKMFTEDWRLVAEHLKKGPG